MEYRIAQGWRIAAVVFAIIFFAGGVALFLSPVYSAGMHNKPMLAVQLGMACISIGWVVWADTIKTRITMDGNTLTKEGAFNRTALLVDEIEGYRKVKDNLLLVPKYGGPPAAAGYNKIGRRPALPLGQFLF